MKVRACKKCSRLTKEEVCSVCGASTSQYCSGYVGIINPDKSEIAKSMDIKETGQYALKVR